MSGALPQRQSPYSVEVSEVSEVSEVTKCRSPHHLLLSPDSMEAGVACYLYVAHFQIHSISRHHFAAPIPAGKSISPLEVNRSPPNPAPEPANLPRNS